MKLVDKLLVSAAGLAVYGIFMILFSGELSSGYFNPGVKESKPDDLAVLTSREIPANSVSASDPEKKNQDNQPNSGSSTGEKIVLYGGEIDEIIQSYYKNIKQNPEDLEEENRIIQEGATGSDLDFLKNQNLLTEKGKIKFDRYKVKDGDSLWRISQKFNVPVYSIVSANPEKAREIIRPGDELLIPGKSGLVYKIKNGDKLSQIAKKYGVTQDDIIRANGVDPDRIYRGQEIFIPGAKPVVEYKTVVKNRFIWPTYGKITSGYGMRNHPLYRSMQHHAGIDIGTNMGNRILASADGVVVFAGDGGTYGNMAIIRHKDGYMTVYAHASKLQVSRGQYVKQGQSIGSVGMTGAATGPHLHFEIKKYNKTVNPTSALNEKIKYQVKVDG